MNILGLEIRRTGKEKLPETLEYINSIIEDENPDILVLPEKWYTPKVTMDEAISILSKINSGNLKISVPGSFSVTERERLYNRAFILNRGRVIGFQDKLVPYGPEKGKYYPGSSINIFEIDGIKFAVPICYDIDFPFFVKVSVKQGADLIVNPSLIRKEFRKEWYLYVEARSLENRVAVISVNSSSEPFAGGSIFSHPYEYMGGAKLHIYEASKERVKGEFIPDKFRHLKEKRITEDPGIYSAGSFSISTFS